MNHNWLSGLRCLCLAMRRTRREAQERSFKGSSETSHYWNETDSVLLNSTLTSVHTTQLRPPTEPASLRPETVCWGGHPHNQEAWDQRQCAEERRGDEGRGISTTSDEPNMLPLEPSISPRSLQASWILYALICSLKQILAGAFLASSELLYTPRNPKGLKLHYISFN